MCGEGEEQGAHWMEKVGHDVMLHCLLVCVCLIVADPLYYNVQHLNFSVGRFWFKPCRVVVLMI